MDAAPLPPAGLDDLAPGAGRRARGRPLTWALALAWLGLHLAGLAAGGWRLGGDALTWASLDADTLRRYGVLVPALVSEGEIQRLLTGALFVGGGALSLAFSLSALLSAAGSLERTLGSARTGLVLAASALGGAGLAMGLWPHYALPIPGAWDVVLGAVGATIPAGLARGGREGRTAVSSALAFVALTVVLVLATSGGRVQLLYSSGAGFAAGVLVAVRLGPRRAQATPPSTGVRAAALLTLLGTLLAVGAQGRHALASPDAARAERLIGALAEVEAEAKRLWDARDPSRVPPGERRALGERLDALRASPDLQGLDGAEALRAYLESLRPIATGDLRDPTAVLPRLRAGYARWLPFERTLLLDHGLLPRSAAPWR